MIKSIKIKFDKYVAETPKAYLVKYLSEEVWFPKSLCKNFAVHGNDMHGVIEIPIFLFKKITGKNPNTEDVDLHDYKASIAWQVIVKTPEKISFTESKPMDEWKR